MSKYQNQENRIQPKHGEEVDVNGTPCLFLDCGTRKGIWLSPNKAACVLANEDKIRLFLAKHNAKKPAVQAPAVSPAELDQLKADRERLAKDLAELKASIASMKAKPAVTEAPARFNPVAS